jgi:hypothetical protein
MNKELKEFEFVNRHNAGTSYIRALENTQTIDIKGAEQTIDFLKMLYSSFESERKGVFPRWEKFNLNFSYNILECLENREVIYFLSLFKKRNFIELGESLYFKIIVTKKDDDFNIIIDTYAHILLNESVATFLSEENAKEMILKKLNILKNK